MAIELKKNEPTYGESYGGYLVWKVYEENNRYKTLCIKKPDSIITEVVFNYDTETNTYKNSSAKEITKKEFDNVLREAKRKMRETKY